MEPRGRASRATLQPCSGGPEGLEGEEGSGELDGRGERRGGEPRAGTWEEAIPLGRGRERWSLNGVNGEREERAENNNATATIT